MDGTVVLHVLHVASAVVWLGGLVSAAWVVWPALLRRPAREARAGLVALGPRMGRVMAAAGMTLVVTGVLRGTVWGPVQSWEALLGTGYGQKFLAALGITLFIMVFSGWARARLAERLWAGESYRPGGARFVHMTNGVLLAASVAILVMMVRMRFGG